MREPVRRKARESVLGKLVSSDQAVAAPESRMSERSPRRIFVANGFWWFDDRFSGRKMMLDPIFPLCEWKMSKLAKILGVGERTLSRTIENSLGIRGKTWLRQVRVVSIRQVLSGELKIESVANYFGFSQHSDLTREFKNLVGVTPTEYMRKERSLLSFGRVRNF